MQYPSDSHPAPRALQRAPSPFAGRSGSAEGTEHTTGEGALPRLDSAALMRGHKTVHIAHNGSIYRLQATKLGKLILTK